MKCKANNCICEDEPMNEGMKYHAACYNAWKAKEATKKPTAWHDDPVVDQLMKLNANLGIIAKELQRLNDRAEE